MRDITGAYTVIFYEEARYERYEEVQSRGTVEEPFHLTGPFPSILSSKSHQGHGGETRQAW